MTRRRWARRMVTHGLRDLFVMLLIGTGFVGFVIGFLHHSGLRGS